uniref:NBS-LRR disease resistance protein n=1 Tax=Dasypyrum villosum TaxID=40247 RepID=A0A8K1MIX4_9POAL|nr:NBS-LRR disease resistance protein [Dasypyrum villosum]
MEATALSVGKSVLNGALSYAKSALAEEVALQLGVRRDQVFITNELEMMQAFLMSAHDEGHDNRVVKVWVKQVRDVAYDVEDTLQELAVRLEKQSWWRIRRTLLNRRRVAKQMKELRANVEDVSQRNMRYNLINGASSKAAMAAEQSSISSAALFGIEEARRTSRQEKSNLDLFQLINQKENRLKIIGVWGTSIDLGQASIIRTVYENQETKSKFPCRAWVRVMRPFNPKFFVQCLVEQFEAYVGVNVLLETEKTSQELTKNFNEYVDKNRYLVVLNDLSTVEEWDRVRKCFPNNSMGSRIIVSTAQVEVASLCAGQESMVSQLRQLSADHNIYAFHEKESSSTHAIISTDNNSTVPTGEISDDQSKGADKKDTVKKSMTRIRTVVTALEESHLVGREKEKVEIIKLISDQPTQKFQVVTVWGMGGLGKTTLVKDIYQNQELSGTFEKRACVTIMRPFNLEGLLRSLIMQLGTESSEKKDVIGLMGSTKNILLMMPLAELIKELTRLLEGKRCLIVLDDLSSTVEWNMIIPIFHGMEKTSRIIVTTREKNIADVCSEKKENIYMLKDLEYKDAHDLFTKKETIDLDTQYPELVEQAELILKKCGRLPLAISCFLYMPIFPEDHKVGRGRLARRWSAEGYSREVRGKSVEEIADSYFMELISRSMILPSQQSIHSTKGISSCQVHDLIREIGISKSMEENLVFTLEEGCNSSSQTTARHLAISSNWMGDLSEFESMVDMSRLRSVTCFAEWKSFFVSDKMRLLRVLDLEDTTGLCSHHLKDIGKLLHLRYLSLRGCDGVFHLPDSFGNLRQLETLDIRGTNILMLPKTIIKLQKLNNLRAGSIPFDEDVSWEEYTGRLPEVLKNRPCISFFMVALGCFAYCAPQLVEIDDTDHRQLCSFLCYRALPAVMMHLDEHGVVVPKGMRKLKALSTLGVVNIGWRWKVILQDIKGLTRLRKLGVTGVNKENGQELCSAIVDLSHLESLSNVNPVRGKPGLCGCLDGKFPFPETLQSLKLYGNLVKLPEWIQGLNNLVKLKLRSSWITEHYAAIQVFGNLPNLAFLHLLEKSVELSMGLDESLKSVKFEQGAAPKLEVLKFGTTAYINSSFLWVYHPREPQGSCGWHNYTTSELAYLRAELSENPYRPVLKMV